MAGLLDNNLGLRKVITPFVIFQGRVSLYNPDRPGCHYVDQAGLDLSEIHLPQAVKKVCTTTPGQSPQFYRKGYGSPFNRSGTAGTYPAPAHHGSEPVLDHIKIACVRGTLEVWCKGGYAVSETLPIKAKEERMLLEIPCPAST